MNLNPKQFPTYKSLFPVQTTQTTSNIIDTRFLRPPKTRLQMGLKYRLAFPHGCYLKPLGAIRWPFHPVRKGKGRGISFVIITGA